MNIQPKFNVSLPNGWFLATYASESIQINYEDNGKVFAPLDLMVGKKMFNKFVVSLEYSRALFHDKGFEPYQWQIEGRIGVYN